MATRSTAAAMTTAPDSWLWLYGPSGTGKTAVGYELFTQLVADGYCMGFIEIDQLGMCLPMHAAGRARIKVANVLSALQDFHDADVDGLIVSGDIAGSPMDEVLRHVGSRQPVLCRLRAQPATFEARLHNRGAPEEYAEAAQTYDDVFGSAGEVDIDTDTLTVQEVSAEIRHCIGAWPHRRRRRSSGRALEAVPFELTSASPPTVVLVSGPTAVGKSAVAWEVFMASVTAGVKTAYLDLAQISFVRPNDEIDPENLNLKASNVRTFWRNFSNEGARRLVLSGEIAGQSDIDAYRRALPGARMYVYALTASLDELMRRVVMRGQGLATQLPGDELRGRSEGDLQQVALAAARRANILSQSTVPDLHLNTDGLTVAEVSQRISSHAFPEDITSARRP